MLTLIQRSLMVKRFFLPIAVKVLIRLCLNILSSKIRLLLNDIARVIVTVLRLCGELVRKLTWHLGSQLNLVELLDSSVISLVLLWGCEKLLRTHVLKSWLFNLILGSVAKGLLQLLITPVGLGPLINELRSLRRLRCNQSVLSHLVKSSDQFLTSLLLAV